MNNERVGSSDYQIVRSERKRHYHIWHKGVPNFHIWHKGVPNFHIWHKRVPRIFYHSKISLRLRHNIPQASNETFCSRGTEITQLIGSRIR